MAKAKDENKAQAAEAAEGNENKAQAAEAAEIPASVLEKIQADAAQDAYLRLCAEMGIDPKAVKEKAKAKSFMQEIVEVDIGPRDARINGNPYTGKFMATREVAETVIQMVSAKEQRLLKETIGRDYLNEITASGHIIGYRQIAVHKGDDAPSISEVKEGA